MIDSNRSQLAAQSVIGEIISPRMSLSVARVGFDGLPRALPGIGGITYSHRIGDRCTDVAGDHIEPGVSLRNMDGGGEPDSPTNMAFNALVQVGNRARVVSGDAKGAVGYVTGTHGGCNHVLVDFEDETLEALTIGDKIQVRAHGLGLELRGTTDVAVMNIDPDLLDRLDLSIDADTVEVPVTHKVPAKLMGSGYGHSHAFTGDIDIQLFDEGTVEQHGLASLRFGDIVAIVDMAAGHGRIWCEGAVTIGVIIHSRSFVAGHGPGVTPIMSSKSGKIHLRIDDGANLKPLLYGG